MPEILKSINVLAVDDEASLRKLYEIFFNRLGHKVVSCEDGLDAVEFYRKSWKDIDVVILDMEMPKMNGKEAYFEMRKINPDARVLLTSGLNMEEETQLLMNSGVKGFIQKPFNAKDLSERVKNAIN